MHNKSVRCQVPGVRKIALLAALALGVAWPAFAQNQATVVYRSWSFTGTTNNRSFTVKLRPDLVQYASNFVFRTPMTIQPTNGQASFPLLPASYVMTIDQVSGAFPFDVPDSTNTYILAGLINRGVYIYYPQNSNAVGFASVAGTNISVTTTNGTNTINVPYLADGIPFVRSDNTGNPIWGASWNAVNGAFSLTNVDDGGIYTFGGDGIFSASAEVDAPNFVGAGATISGNVNVGGNAHVSTLTVDNSGTVGGTLAFPILTTNTYLSLDSQGRTASTTSGAGLTSLNASQLSSGTVPIARIPAINTNLLMASTGLGVKADMVASTSSFIGQIGLARSGDDMFAYAASGVGTGSNSWRAQIDEPNGKGYIGSASGMPIGKNPFTQVWWNGNPVDTTLFAATNGGGAPKDGFLELLNPNVHSDGAFLLIPMFTSDPASYGGVGNAAVTNSDGEYIGLRDQFGLTLGTVPFQCHVGPSEQPGSYQIILGAGGGVPLYITANAMFSNEVAIGFPVQHSYACFDQTLYETHFPWWITNVWSYTNTAWRDLLKIDHLTGRMEMAANCDNAPNPSLYLGVKTFYLTNYLQAIFGPGAGVVNHDEVGLFFTTNTAFSWNSSGQSRGGSWTFDGTDVYRWGIVQQSGQYPKLVAASGATMTIGHSSASDLHANIGGQTITADIAIAANGASVTISPPTTFSSTVAIGGGTAIQKVMSASATLDFGSTSAQTSSELTITVTGAAVGDPVSLSTPASPNANTCFTAYVSAADTVKVRFNNYSSGAIDPASGTYRVAVTHF